MKYEYKIVKTRNLSEKELNKLGREGWQMVHITSPSWTHEHELVFMKKKDVPADRPSESSGSSIRGPFLDELYYNPYGRPRTEDAKEWFLRGDDSPA